MERNINIGGCISVSPADIVGITNPRPPGVGPPATYDWSLGMDPATMHGDMIPAIHTDSACATQVPGGDVVDLRHTPLPDVVRFYGPGAYYVTDVNGRMLGVWHEPVARGCGAAWHPVHHVHPAQVHDVRRHVVTCLDRGVTPAMFVPVD